MRRTIQAIFLALAAASMASAVLAAGSLSVGVNESRRLMLHGPAANVIVGDPQIADVAVVDAHSLIVMGRGYGSTDLVVLDHAGRTLYEGRVIVSAPEQNRVTMYAGSASTEFSCSPRCQTLGAKDSSTQTTTTTTSPPPSPATTVSSGPTLSPGG